MKTSSEDMTNHATRYITLDTDTHTWTSSDSLASIMSSKPAATLSKPTWDKFDLLNYELVDDSSLLDLLDKEDLLPTEEWLCSPISEMRHNDCLWAGLFRHKEHDYARSMVLDGCSYVRTATEPAVDPCPSSLCSLLPSKEFATTEENRRKSADEFVLSTKKVCHLTNEEEGSGSSSELEKDNCLEEEVETTMVDLKYVGISHKNERPPSRQPVTSTNVLCTSSDYSEEGVCILSLQPNELLETTVIQEEQQPKQSACSSPLDRKLESLSQESHNFQEELHLKEEVAPPQHIPSTRPRKSVLQTLPHSSSLDKKPAPKRSRKNQIRSSDQLSLKSAMERQRRIYQSNLLQALRRCIPDLIEDEGAPKVFILEEAIEVCKVLQQEEARLERHLNELRQKQTELSQRLKETQSCVLSGDN